MLTENRSDLSGDKHQSGTVAPLPLNEVQPHIVAHALRRRWRWILAMTLIATIAAAAVAILLPPHYTATTKVLVLPIAGNPLANSQSSSSQQTTIAMETEAGLVTSPGVTKLVNKELNTSIEPGSSAVTAMVPANTEIIQIQYTATSASEARDRAQAFADEFLTFRAQQSEATQSAKLASLKKQEADIAAKLTKASKAASITGASADVTSRVSLYASQLGSLQSRIGQAQITETNPGTLVAPATLPLSSDGLPPYLYVIGSAIAGLLAGVAIAIWRERSDDHVRSSTEISIVGLPILAIVSKDLGNQLVDRPDLIVTAVEGYNRARVSVLAGTEPPAVLVVSDLGNLASSVEVSINLGISLANAGYRVIVVDATFEYDAMARQLGVEAAQGLVDLIQPSDPENASDVTQSLEPEFVETHGMRVLTAGDGDSTVAREHVAVAREHLVGKKFLALLTKLRSESDYVLVAAPSATRSDGSAVALAGDSLLLVIEDNHTTHEAVSEAIDRTEQLGVSILGTIVVNRKAARRRQRVRTEGPAPRRRRAPPNPQTTAPLRRKPPKARLPPAQQKSRTPRRQARVR